jgi:flagellar motor switch protein FliG
VIETQRNENMQALNGSDIFTGLRKAAVLLITIGPKVAAKVLSTLPEDEVENIMVEIANCSDISHNEKESILEEFFTDFVTKDGIDKGGMNYVSEVLEKAFGKKRAVELTEKLASSITVGPFHFLKKTEPDQFVNIIKNEHPQTIALVLTYLDYSQASKALSSLKPELQTDVAKRIATMDRTSPEIVSRVEKILERKTSSVINTNLRAVGGVRAIAGILNNVDRTTEKTILKALEKSDKLLANEVRSLMFVFEDILNLDDKAIQRVLKEIDTNVLTMAIKGTSREVKDKIFMNMSERAALLVQEDMEVMGPVRMTDVEKAQQTIVSKIKELDDAGDIFIVRNKNEKFL